MGRLACCRARAEEVAGSYAEDALNLADKPRIFGLLPNNLPFAPFEEDLVRSVFGFAEVSIPSPGRVLRPVEIVRSDLRGGGSHGATTVVDVLRSYVWRDAIRFADVRGWHDWCGAVAESPPPQFSRVADALRTHPSDCRNVLVVCDSIEHLWLQRPWLSGWSRLPEVGPSPSGAGTPTGWPEYPLGVLSTRDALADGQLSLSSFDVLIYAGASPYPPTIPPHLLAVDPAHARPLLLIDFEDRRHSLLRRWSRERADRYSTNGWFPAGIDPVEARVDRFISSRRRR